MINSNLIKQYDFFFLDLFKEQTFTSRETRVFRETRFAIRSSIDSNVRKTLNQGSRPHRSECLYLVFPLKY